MIPALETERLILSGPTVDDYSDIAATWSDPEVVHYIGGVPFSAEDTWTRLLRYAGHWALLGFGTWIVREKVGGDFVGDVGLLDLHRNITPRLDLPELGWVLAKRAHGKGYATRSSIRASRDRPARRQLSYVARPSLGPSIARRATRHTSEEATRQRWPMVAITSTRRSRWYCEPYAGNGLSLLVTLAGRA